RCRMHETIRNNALDRLNATGEAYRFQRAHADCYLELAERAESDLLGGGRQAEWLDVLKEDHDNLRAALSWFIRHGPADHGLRLAGPLRPFSAPRGYLDEGREGMCRPLPAPAAPPPPASRGWRRQAPA